MTEVEYRQIPGWEGYYSAGNDGSIRSDRFARTLRPAPDHKGYLNVSLCRGGVCTTKKVHVLVAAAFHGPRPDGMEVAHEDGVKVNCSVDNLRYKTASENVRDAIRHGTHPQARKTECPQGHSYTPENTYTVPTTGARHCRACRRERKLNG